MSDQWSADLLKDLLDREQRLRDDLTRERDRRYAEVDVEREKALRIKDEGDKAARAIKDESDKEAMRLAREIQTYKDEKANELREQISSERGLYASKEDLVNLEDKIYAVIKPLAELVNSLQLTERRGAGGAEQMARQRTQNNWIIGLMVMAGLNFVGVIAAFVYFMIGRS